MVCYEKFRLSINIIIQKFTAALNRETFKRKRLIRDACGSFKFPDALISCYTSGISRMGRIRLPILKFVPFKRIKSVALRITSKVKLASFKTEPVNALKWIGSVYFLLFRWQLLETYAWISSSRKFMTPWEAAEPDSVMQLIKSRRKLTRFVLHNLICIIFTWRETDGRYMPPR